MGELLKDIYSKEFYNNLSDRIGEVVPLFSKKAFLNQIFDETWDELELKQRIRHTTLVLGEVFPKEYSLSAKYIKSLIDNLIQKGTRETGIKFIFLPDFIEVFGINNFETSVSLIEYVTQFTSCEFAVRPFIIKYPKKMVRQLKNWSKHKNEHVRRLASEGSRPRLPWAMALPEFKKDPTPIFPILENLKNDTSLYVRRSVANNLNDIAKDNPNSVITIAQNWYGKNEETDWLVKHGCRTLLKQGNQEILKLFGFGSAERIKIKNFKVLTPKVRIEKSLMFTFDLLNANKNESKIRLEYGLYYKKANGSLSKKVFKISERIYPPNSLTTINRKQSFKLITTRKFYIGQHKLSLIINGVELEKVEFELIS